MKFNRRNFIKQSSLVTLSAMIPKINLEIQTQVEVNKPIVISTWNFGLKANDKAWEVLNNSGRALDAVEQGVRFTENDPTERSVGYGGRPCRLPRNQYNL